MSMSLSMGVAVFSGALAAGIPAFVRSAVLESLGSIVELSLVLYTTVREWERPTDQQLGFTVKGAKRKRLLW